MAFDLRQPEEKSFQERIKDLFKPRMVSSLTEEREDPRGRTFKEKLSDVFFPGWREEERRQEETEKPEVRGMETPTAIPTETPTKVPTKAPITTTPEPTPTLTPNASKTTVKYTDTASNYFPNEEVNNALNVMFEESSGDPNATHLNTNGTTDYGLMQINSIHKDLIRDAFGYTMEDMLDPKKNLEVAGLLFELFGWWPWVGAKKLGLVG